MGRNGHRADRRSSEMAVEECGDGTRRGEGCSHAVDHDRDRRSHPEAVLRDSHRHRRESPASANGSAHADAGSQIEARRDELTPFVRVNLGGIGDLHRRCSGPWRP